MEETTGLFPSFAEGVKVSPYIAGLAQWRSTRDWPNATANTFHNEVENSRDDVERRKIPTAFNDPVRGLEARMVRYRPLAP